MIIADDYHFEMSPNGKWIKKPSRLLIAFHTKSFTKADKIAEEIVKNN